MSLIDCIGVHRTCALTNATPVSMGLYSGDYAGRNLSLMLALANIASRTWFRWNLGLSITTQTISEQVSHRGDEHLHRPRIENLGVHVSRGLGDSSFAPFAHFSPIFPLSPKSLKFRHFRHILPRKPFSAKTQKTPENRKTHQARTLTKTRRNFP